MRQVQKVLGSLLKLASIILTHRLFIWADRQEYALKDYISHIARLGMGVPLSETGVAVARLRDKRYGNRDKAWRGQGSPSAR